MLLYATDINGTGQMMRDLYQSLTCNCETNFCSSLDCLELNLRQMRHNPRIAVLLIANRQELLDILNLRELFEPFSVILILPDEKKETIRMGHTLFPRFLSFKDSDFNWVIAVLNKMLEKHGVKQFK